MTHAAYSEFFGRHADSRAWSRTAWLYNGKLAGRELAQQMGLRVPDLVSAPAPFAELPAPPAGLPVVLKPASGSSGWGVAPLVPCDGGLYRSLLTGQIGKWREHADAAWDQRRRIHRKRPVSELHQVDWIIEELIVGDDGGMADDVKCYCFGGRVEVIRQRRPGLGRGGREGAANSFWSRSWERLSGVDRRRSLAGLPRPDGAEEIVHAAERVAGFLRAPFVRVDFYPRAIFGEVTPHPGGDHWTPQWDIRLGAAWEAALLTQ